MMKEYKACMPCGREIKTRFKAEEKIEELTTRFNRGNSGKN
jgi:hypothetical protein